MSRHLLYVALLALCALSAVSFSTASTSGVDVMSDDFVDATLVELLHTATNTNAEGDASDAGVDEASTEESAPVIVGDGPNRYEVPQLPPLKVGLTEETQPAIHPASGVAPGGVGPTAAELEAIGGPIQPPEGCAHLITAWKNYIWHHRTLPDSGVGGKDKYPQHIIEERFGFFCNNLKHHQIQSANRERVTVKQPDLSYKPINEEHLTWNKYYDLENLKHLRGFRYSTPFRHLTSHSDYLEREFIRTHGTKPAPEDRAAALARKLDALPTSVMDPPSQDHTAPDYPPQSSSRRLLSESEVEAESEFELDPPVISTPAQSLKQVARDPLIPDFDFSLNHNIVGAPYDQNNCGGDWAVHSAAVIEYTFAIQCQDAPYAKTLAELNFGEISSQHLLACSSGNGCKNGDITDALSFALRWPLRNRESYPLAPETFLSEKHIVSVPKCDLSQNEAIEKSAARPLISSFGFAIHTCKQRSDDPFNLCLDQDEEELARFVAKQPVTAVIDANDAVFSALYSGYIITAKDCSSAAGAGDHVVTIVGLLTDAKTGKKVWKIQNSYGQDWGHDGFAYLEYGYNTCGIANYNAFVQTTCQRSVGLNPPPRPATPKQAPEPVTAKSIDVPPPKPAIVPTVPVTPVLGGAPAVDPKQVLAASANSIPWWQVADAKTTVNTMQAATQVVAPAAAAAPTAPAIVSALKAVVQTAALPTASAPAAAPVTAPVPSAK